MSGANGTQSPGGNGATDPNTPTTPQTPPAGDPQAGAPTTPATPQAPATPPVDDDQPITLAKAKELRAENHGMRTRATTAETALAEAQAKLAVFERGQMTELQKAQADAQAATAKAEAAQTALGTAAIQAAATKLGMFDPSDAAALLAQVKYKADGQPENAEDLVRAYVATRPHLIDAKRVGGSPTNPGQGAASVAGVFRSSQLKDLDFWVANEAAIKQAMIKGLVVKDD